MKPTNIGSQVVPALLVRNMGQTLTFYQNLGFQITGCYPNRLTPTWAEVKRDSVVFQFHTEPPSGTPRAPICSGTFYIFPENVSALAEEFRSRVDFAWGPEVMEYGMREFAVQDPNGYFIAFAEPA